MEQLTAHPGRILIFLAVPPVGLGPRTPVPWAQENVAYFVQSPERRSYIGAYPPRRYHRGNIVVRKRPWWRIVDGGGGGPPSVPPTWWKSGNSTWKVGTAGSARRCFGSRTPYGRTSSSFLLLLLFRYLVLLLTPPLPAHDQASVQASHFIHSEKVIESTIRSSK